MRRKTITSARDLRTHLSDMLGSAATEDDIETLLELVAADDHPRYGDDWTAYLAALEPWATLQNMRVTTEAR